MVTLDPMNTHLNVTRGAYNVSKVQNLFSLAYDKLILATETRRDVLKEMLDIKVT